MLSDNLAGSVKATPPILRRTASPLLIFQFRVVSGVVMTAESSSSSKGCLDPSCRNCRITYREIGVAIQPGIAGGFVFHAVEWPSGDQDLRRWLDAVEAPTVDAALLEVFCRFAADGSVQKGLHFIVDLPRGYPLWHSLAELAVALPQCHVQRPAVGDAALISAARCGLPFEFTWGPYQPPPEMDELDFPQLPSVNDLQPLTVATDGSVRRKFIGYGWLASDGEFGLHGAIYEKRHIGSEVALVAELLALNDAVMKLPYRPLTLMCDSSFAIHMVRRWMDGDDLLPQGYSSAVDGTFKGDLAALARARLRFRRNRDRLTIRRVQAHRGEPLNEGADALARLASRYAMGDSGLSNSQYCDRAKGLAQGFAKAFREDRHG